jgi:hypothetical protein
MFLAAWIGKASDCQAISHGKNVNAPRKWRQKSMIHCRGLAFLGIAANSLSAAATPALFPVTAVVAIRSGLRQP